MMFCTKLDEDYITRNLLNTKERLPEGADGMTYRQLSLFDDMSFGVKDAFETVSGKKAGI